MANYGRKKRAVLIDLVLAALEEAKAARSPMTVTLLEMAYLNEMEEERSSDFTTMRRRYEDRLH